VSRVERVVFDTNVWVSGLLWRGKPYQCLVLVRAGVVRPVYCPQMLAELADKLRTKFRFPLTHLQAATHDLRSKGELVEIPGTLHVVPDDPDDDKFVECAVVAGCSRIVSGDAHILSLCEYGGIHIISPAEFLAHLVW